ncbi:hypothetical protein GC102_21845 [Paenibacillus sp. LMG 31460]|uniref:Uncharacterized protein n=1 Tax=Paenibacillus germinis TaxID=2654979 RepID=A0ABX1Z6D0_9BACL|nr:hypothetical protein [Paenibacillus germinis]NOU88379.1 hypothetical protein [Paenibacillus germinis]
MKFCLYDNIQEQVVLIENNLLSAYYLKTEYGLSSDISVLPILSKDEYLSFPASFRGEVSGRSYLLFKVSGVVERRYDQVIVRD